LNFDGGPRDHQAAFTVFIIAFGADILVGACVERWGFGMAIVIPARSWAR
jgi:hypothetical protein